MWRTWLMDSATLMVAAFPPGAETVVYLLDLRHWTRVEVAEHRGRAAIRIDLLFTAAQSRGKIVRGSRTLARSAWRRGWPPQPAERAR